MTPFDSWWNDLKYQRLGLSAKNAARLAWNGALDAAHRMAEQADDLRVGRPAIEELKILPPQRSE